MNKYIHFILLLLLFSCLKVSAQNSNTQTSSGTVPVSNGYYQTIDLDPNTSCDCNQKTNRTKALSKGLVEFDVINYKLHAYRFSFDNSYVILSKLFKALENDSTVYKVSMKEWDSFMLLTTDKFDVASFEKAAQLIFQSFMAMQPEEFLKLKSTNSYNEYVQKLQKEKN